MTMMRLQKFISSAGLCSRRHGEVMIQAGRVRVNGQVVTELGTKIDPRRDRVDVDGHRLQLPKHRTYIALHKPKGYVTSCRQPGEPIVLDLVDVPERLFPVGRLDKDSTGLLILTDDGRLHHRLSHPSFDHEKEYDVTVAKPITDGTLQKLADGMPLLGSRTRSAEIRRLSTHRFRIILKEGKNRQIRRMLRKVGHQVTRLHRRRVASVKLGRLAPGAWRQLSGTEIRELLKMI
jgi:23S rRNA pseudouridine2605 synthase/23S rRNA pseudouridine2604 synthase